MALSYKKNTYNMKNQYSQKLFGAVLALIGMGVTTNAQVVSFGGPQKVHVIAKDLRLHAHIPSVTVGDTLKLYVKASVTDTFALSITDTGGVVVQTATVTGGKSVLASLPIGKYHFSLLGADSTQALGRFEVKAPHVHSNIHSEELGDTLHIRVRADSAALFTLTISDTSGVVQTLTVSGGKTDLPALPIGKYSYTLTNADGLVVSDGKFSVKAPHVRSDVRSVVFGDTLFIRVKAPATESFTLAISDTGGVVQTLTVAGGKTALPTLPVGKYSYTLTNSTGLVVSTGKFAVVAPHVHSGVHSAVLGDTLRIYVLAPVTESFTLAISDTGGVVQTLTVTGGISALPMLPIGKYSYTLANADGLVVSKGKFAVKAPHVHSDIHSLTLGDTLHIHVIALATASFELSISDTSGVVQNLSVTGGVTALPLLPIGKYSYTLTDASGIVVSDGKFEVRAPHVHAKINSNRFTLALSIKVNAPATETFALTVTDTSGATVLTATVTGGTTALDSLPVGKYAFTLVNAAGIQVEKGKFEVKTQLVHTDIYPNPSTVGTGSIIINAPATEIFTLVILDGSSTPVYTGAVTGGTTLLPNTLSAGLYHYRVINASGGIVAKGKIMILL